MKRYKNVYFIFRDRTFVSERNEASGCASASIHSRSGSQDEVTNHKASLRHVTLIQPMRFVFSMSCDLNDNHSNELYL